MAASSNVIQLFAHRAAQQRPRRPVRVFAVYQEELDARASANRRFAVTVLGATAAVLAIALLA